MGAASKQVHYQSVVDEFELGADPTNIFELLSGLFRTGRKLKPLVQKRVPRSIDTLDQSKIMVHVIRATDVPIRVGFYNEFVRKRAEDD